MGISTHLHARKIEIFVLIILVFALANTLQMVKKEVKAFRKHRIDSAVVYEQKFAGIGSLIPTGEPLSFVSDESDSGAFGKSLYLTQYALAPVKVSPDPSAKYVVASFKDPVVQEKYEIEHHLTLIKKIDKETALYMKRTQ